MRMSVYFAPTLKEAPSEAEVPSHKLLLRAGYIRKLASGIYEYLPLGLRVLRKIENIIRKHMDEAGALEVLLPILTPAELWQETGRWDVYGKELFRLKDRKNRDFALGPTHEETITDLVRKNIRSYKDLPKNFYQIQTKFRDEARPRYGLIRGREFLMKDAYSFDVSEEMAVKSYELMKKTYHKIFSSLGLDYLMVEADVGAIGGKYSHEFVVKVPNGEAHIVYCESCGYAANVETAKYEFELDKLPPEEEKPLEKVYTPNVKSVEEVAEFLNVKYTVGVGNGTDALHLALRTAGVEQGDKVITTPFSFIATTEAILYTGATPVFVDINPDTYNIDTDKIICTETGVHTLQSCFT